MIVSKVSSLDPNAASWSLRSLVILTVVVSDIGSLSIASSVSIISMSLHVYRCKQAHGSDNECGQLS